MAVKNSPLNQNLSDGLTSLTESVPSEGVIISRLKSRADFIKARNGARSHERAFVLQLFQRDLSAEDAQPTHLRIGFTVTKKIGNAVVRNRIKRRLREAVKQAEIPNTVAGYDAVFIARIETLDMPFQELVSSISHSLVNTSSGTKRPRSK